MKKNQSKRECFQLSRILVCVVRDAGRKTDIRELKHQTVGINV